MRERDIVELMELTIASAYEAVLHEESWGSALEHLTKLTGANSSTYVAIDNAAPEIIQTHALDPAIMQAYNSEFAEHDPFHGEIMRSANSRVVHDRREVDNDFIRGSVWFQEFYRQHRIHSIMALPLFESGNLAGSFNIQRSVGQGDFTNQEFAAMAKIAPHLVRAAQISAKITALRRSVIYGNAVLDKLSLPILLLEQCGKVVLVNLAAEELIRHEPSFRLSQDRFTVTVNGIETSSCATSKMTETVIQRGKTRKPLRMTTLPLAPHSALNTSWQRPLCMVVFDDPEVIPVSLNELLLNLFCLTPSEVRVCIAVGCEGLSPQECAEIFGVSITTIRSQIRGVYGKMGIKRQAELVRMLTMLNMTRKDEDN